MIARAAGAARGWRLLVPRYGNFSRRRGPRAPPMVATASQGSPRGGWQPSGATVVTQPWGADAVSPCGPAALPTACETSYPPPSNSAALAQRRYRSGRSTGARPRSRGQARAAWRSRPRLTAWSPPAPGARADRLPAQHATWRQLAAMATRRGTEAESRGKAAGRRRGSRAPADGAARPSRGAPLLPPSHCFTPGTAPIYTSSQLFLLGGLPAIAGYLRSPLVSARGPIHTLAVF